VEGSGVGASGLGGGGGAELWGAGAAPLKWGQVSHAMPAMAPSATTEAVVAAMSKAASLPPTTGSGISFMSMMVTASSSPPQLFQDAAPGSRVNENNDHSDVVIIWTRGLHVHFLAQLEPCLTHK